MLYLYVALISLGVSLALAGVLYLLIRKAAYAVVASLSSSLTTGGLSKMIQSYTPPRLTADELIDEVTHDAAL